MNFVSRFFSRIFMGASDSMQTLALLLGGGKSIGQSYAALVDEGYCGNPDVYGAVRVILDTAQTIPWAVYRLDAAGKPYLDPNAKNANRILTDCNSQGFDYIIETAGQSLLIGGQAFLYGAWPKEIHPLFADEIVVKVDRDLSELNESPKFKLNGFEKKGDATREFTDEEICWIRYPHPRYRDKCVSPLYPFLKTLQATNRAREWNDNLLANGAMPSMAVEFAKEALPDPKQIDDARTELNKNTAGSKQAGKVFIVPPQMRVAKTGFTPADLQWNELLSRATLELSRVYNIPPEVLQDHTNATHSNMGDAYKALGLHAVLPFLMKMADALNSWKGLRERIEDGVLLLPNIEGHPLFIEDEGPKQDRAIRAVAGGILTADEARPVFSQSEDHPDGAGKVPIINGAFVRLADVTAGKTLNTKGTGREDGQRTNAPANGGEPAGTRDPK